MPRVFPLLATLILSSCAGSQCSPRTLTAGPSADAGAGTSHANVAEPPPATSVAIPAGFAEPKGDAPSPAAKQALSPREAFVASLNDRVPHGAENQPGTSEGQPCSPSD